MEYHISEYDGGRGFVLKGASYAGAPRSNTVMYITKKVEHLLQNLSGVSGCLVFISDTVSVPPALSESNCFFATDNPQLEYALFAKKMAGELEREDKSKKYTLADGGYYVGEGVTIGEGAAIAPFSFIGHGVKIGKNARIGAGAKIMNAVIGDDFIAGEGCTVGTSGFTMAADAEGNKMRIPTLGGVTIGNGVEISALTNISCGSAGDTVLEDYVKLDSLIHIGHDARLCKNVEITAGATIGGFVVLRERVYIGVGAVLRNRIEIGENTIVGMGSIVTKSHPANITIAGNPARIFEKKQ